VLSEGAVDQRRGGRAGEGERQDGEEDARFRLHTSGSSHAKLKSFSIGWTSSRSGADPVRLYIFRRTFE
jgi:hypothetical protein